MKKLTKDEKGTNYETIMPDHKKNRRYQRYDKVCRKCGKVVGGCFSGPGLPEPRVDSKAICPWCPLGTEYNIELVLAEDDR